MGNIDINSTKKKPICSKLNTSDFSNLNNQKSIPQFAFRSIHYLTFLPHKDIPAELSPEYTIVGTRGDTSQSSSR